MKEITKLPNEETLDKLIGLAKSAEQKASNLYESATKIDEKWRKKLDNQRKLAIQKLDSTN
ncbi:MAG: hypothetical protein QNJ34_11460 [Xenococcaceae cyanobacterium MO_188.B29]|nr:hypothetical protein [Xenococcaceae cyanobacterium MO_188.B29]